MEVAVRILEEVNSSEMLIITMMSLPGDENKTILNNFFFVIKFNVPAGLEANYLS